MPEKKKTELAKQYAEEFVEYQQTHSALMHALNDDRVSVEQFEQLKEELCDELTALKETKVELRKHRDALGGEHQQRGEA